MKSRTAAKAKCKSAYNCNECRQITEQNPRGWISSSCHRCGMPVFFCKLADRNAYTADGPYTRVVKTEPEEIVTLPSGLTN